MPSTWAAKPAAHAAEGVGHAEVVEEHHGKHQIIKDIRLRGRLSTGLELQCARCLEPVRAGR